MPRATGVISVVIPTYERPERLRTCIEAFEHITLPREKWELLVVNDGGTTSFRDISADLEKRLPLRLVDAERTGPAHARNRGAELATGEFLAFTDDDCEVLPDWLGAFERGFAQTNADALGGQTQNPYPNSPAAAAWQDYLDFICDFCCDERDMRLLLPSNNVAYRRGAFETAGGFDERFPLAAAEDFELGFRLVAKGFRQAFWPDARIWHHHPLTPRSYLNMQFRYGRGEVPLRRALKSYDHPKIAKHRRRRFWLDLVRHLRSRNAPLSTWALVIASQPTYHLGHVTEVLRRVRASGVSDSTPASRQTATPPLGAANRDPRSPRA